jgi:hypothetical protein
MRIAAAAGLGLLLALAPARAEECPTGEGLRESPVFEEFGAWIDDAYPAPAVIDLRTELIVVGHALGRSAAAAEGDAHRTTILACLVVAIEQVLAETARDEMDPEEIERLVLAAWRGELDDEVAEATGVRDRAPAEAYFARLAPWGEGGPPPAQAPWSTRPAPPEPPTEPDLPVAEPPAILPGERAGVRLRGHEYRLLEIADQASCHVACAEDLRCSAYTFVPPRGPGTRPHCELRSGPGEEYANDCCVSVVVRPPHPWAGLCAADLAARGHAPLLARSDPDWGELVVFFDPLDGSEVGIEHCQLAPWDRALFEQGHEPIEARDLAPGEHERFRRIETWRSLLGDTVEIGHYHR